MAATHCRFTSDSVLEALRGDGNGMQILETQKLHRSQSSHSCHDLYIFIIHPSSVLSRCHFRKGRTAQQHMLGNGTQPDLPRIHMAYADDWLAPCGLKGNDDDDEKDDKDSASISAVSVVDIL